MLDPDTRWQAFSAGGIGLGSIATHGILRRWNAGGVPIPISGSFGAIAAGTNTIGAVLTPSVQLSYLLTKTGGDGDRKSVV